MPNMVTTPEECLRYVESVDFCTWRHQPKLAGVPSLELVTAWRGGELTLKTWFWKDDLHIERRLYFGMLVAPDIPVFVSRSFLPSLIAAQGDIDARTLYEKGLLSSTALNVYEHVARTGPTATQAFPWPSGSRMLSLAQLQQKFLLTKYDLTGRTRGTYGYRWCLCENAFPASFAEAAQIRVSSAREQVYSCLNRHGADLSRERIARLLRWQPYRVKDNVAMALTATTEIQPKYLRMTVTGEWALADAIALVGRLKEEAGLAALRHIFVDARGIGGARASWTDRSKLGQEIAEILPGFRLAVVARAEVVDHSTEVVANNRGAKMTVKRSEEEALRWLLE